MVVKANWGVFLGVALDDIDVGVGGRAVIGHGLYCSPVLVPVDAAGGNVIVSLQIQLSPFSPTLKEHRGPAVAEAPTGVIVEIVLEKDAKQERSLFPFGLGLPAHGSPVGLEEGDAGSSSASAYSLLDFSVIVPASNVISMTFWIGFGSRWSAFFSSEFQIHCSGMPTSSSRSR